MKTLDSKTRQYLKGLAHSLKPIMIIGQNGVTETLIKGLNEALDYHELLKIKFGDLKDRKVEICDQLSLSTGSEKIGMIGNIAIFYRRQKNDKKRKINIPVNI